MFRYAKILPYGQIIHTIDFYGDFSQCDETSLDKIEKDLGEKDILFKLLHPDDSSEAIESAVVVKHRKYQVISTTEYIMARVKQCSDNIGPIISVQYKKYNNVYPPHYLKLMIA